jgi:hypothetical protein
MAMETAVTVMVTEAVVKGVMATAVVAVAMAAVVVVVAMAVTEEKAGMAMGTVTAGTAVKGGMATAAMEVKAGMAGTMVMAKDTALRVTERGMEAMTASAPAATAERANPALHTAAATIPPDMAAAKAIPAHPA